ARVLHHNPSDIDRIELRNRRQCAGTAHLDLNVLENRGRPFSREFVRDRPARAARYEAKPLLPIEPVELIDHAIDIVVELAALELDLPVKVEHVLERTADLPQRI